MTHCFKDRDARQNLVCVFTTLIENKWMKTPPSLPHIDTPGFLFSWRYNNKVKR